MELQRLSFPGRWSFSTSQHLKLTGHQPSQSKQDNRRAFKDFRKCYTCEMEFDGYYNLMTHRNKTHPSNRKCKNYPGSCPHGSKCWFRHVEPMDSESSVTNEILITKFKCNLCEYTCQDKSSFMIHKKQVHKETVKNCEAFRDGKCFRNDTECWFIHSSISKPRIENKQQNDQVFQQATSDPVPPDHMSRIFWMFTNLSRKFENMEKRLDEVMI